MEKKRFGMQLDDDTCDLKIRDGRISVDDTMSQNQYLILVSNKGELRENPTMGVGISDMLNDNDVTGWRRKIRDGLKDDGMSIEALNIANDGRITQLSAQYD